MSDTNAASTTTDASAPVKEKKPKVNLVAGISPRSPLTPFLPQIMAEIIRPQLHIVINSFGEAGISSIVELTKAYNAHTKSGISAQTMKAWLAYFGYGVKRRPQLVPLAATQSNGSANEPLGDLPPAMGNVNA